MGMIEPRAFVHARQELSQLSNIPNLSLKNLMSTEKNKKDEQTKENVSFQVKICKGTENSHHPLWTSPWSGDHPL